MNDVLKTMYERVSLRGYDDRPITQEDLDAILKAAMRAPTAGNQMLYSILVIRNEETKKILSKTCDNQAFIATAPLILVFLADHQRWFDYYEQNDVAGYCEEHGLQFEGPQESDLMLAIQDTMIAAQNAAIAAESLGIGSCYIGDIMENYEIHKKLFDLPDWAFPIGMLCLGYYRPNQPKIVKERFDPEYIIFEEKYRHLTSEEYQKMFASREKIYKEDNIYDAKNFAQMFYARKTGAQFSKEMARSVRVALKQWDGRILNPKIGRAHV